MLQAPLGSPGWGTHPRLSANASSIRSLVYGVGDLAVPSQPLSKWNPFVSTTFLKSILVTEGFL